MKNYILFGMLICLSLSMNAQIYAYKHVYSVNSYGEKIKGTNRVVYYTFSDEFRACMRSDKYGENTGEGHEHSAKRWEYNGNSRYFYKETRKNIHYYYGIALKETVSTKRNYTSGNRTLPFMPTVEELAELRDATTRNFNIEQYEAKGVVLKFSSDFSKLNIVPYSNISQMETLIYERCSLNETESRINSEFYD